MSNAIPTEDAAVLALRKEREAFIARVRENERLAAADPQGYRRRLKGLVYLAYGYIGLLLLLTLLTAGGLMVAYLNGYRIPIKLAIIVVVFLLALLRSLWVKIERPGGLLLVRSQAPKLWEEVEAIADRLKAPRPNEIRLDEDFNASAAQWPRFGMFGGYGSTLTLGLPLLASLAPDEARGVIAHEFGHFSGKHGRFGVWIYRVHATFAQLTEGGSGGPFWKWFEPRFAATSFALRRQHEYEADRAAAEIVGAPTVGATLARLDALGAHQERTFWNPFRSAVERAGPPAGGYFMRMTEAVRQRFDLAQADQQLAFALAQPTDFGDTHPSLTDRLASLGVPAPTHIEANAGGSAAEAFFGDTLPSVAAALEADYAKRMDEVWTKLSARREAMTKTLAEIDGKARTSPPSEDEVVERAFLRAQLAAPEETVPIYRELVAFLPENGHAAFLLGDALIDEDDADGLAILDHAAEREPKVRDEVRASLARYHARHGDAARYAKLREEAIEASDRQAVAEAASGLDLRDALLPLELAPGDRERIASVLATVKGLGYAYAVRKRLPGTGELREYLVLLPSRTTLPREDEGDRLLKQLIESDADFGRSFTVFAAKESKPWLKKLESMPESLVFDHKPQ